MIVNLIPGKLYFCLEGYGAESFLYDNVLFTQCGLLDDYLLTKKPFMFMSKMDSYYNTKRNKYNLLGGNYIFSFTMSKCYHSDFLNCWQII